MQRIVVVGGGFAGLWSAIGAARRRDEAGAQAAHVEILLVDRNPFHAIRVRNYEADLADAVVPFSAILDPIGVAHRVGEVLAIDTVAQQMVLATPQGEATIGYDRLVLAAGSALIRPTFPGHLNAFDVDTNAAAEHLNAHIAALADQPASAARDTVVVAGAGFTGLEVAAEMPEKLRRALDPNGGRVVLVDRNPVLAPAYSEDARAIIALALADLGVELRLGTSIRHADPGSVTLANGETIAARTLVWCAGMRASPLAATLPAAHDALGRLTVDAYLRVPGLPGVFAAGDSAVCRAEDGHESVMSCQHARPMGRFAGHNALADLLGEPLLPLHLDWYVTVLDLGRWGALYTVGRDRRVLSAGAAAKVVKETINRVRIYPPRTGSRADILAAAAPVVQVPPAEVRGATASASELAGGGPVDAADP